ncbi:hypothetical protein GCM10028810_37310 [Spirosoma litoris]
MDLRLKFLRKHIQEQRSNVDQCSTDRLKLKDEHLLERSQFYGQLNDKQRNWHAMIMRHSMELTELSRKNQMNRQELLIRQAAEEAHLEELIAFQEQLFKLNKKNLAGCPNP